MTTKKLLPLLTAATALAATSAHAAVYTLGDITRSAGGGSIDTNFEFDPSGGWTGTPPNAISGEDSVYLAFTVSWTAASDIGFVDVQYNAGDNGGAGRWSVRKPNASTGFYFETANNTGDRDGSGPATARPTIDPIDTTTVTSATFVLKVDQLQAAITPLDYPDQPLPVLYDRWYGDTAAQDEACGFLYINPDLGAPEAGQSTNWAAWRSGNASYRGVSFQTNANTDITFSNIAIYTGDDTPFVPEPSTALLGGIGLLGLLRRRRS